MKWFFLVGALLIVVLALIADIGALLPKHHSAALSARFDKPPQIAWETITGSPDWRANVRSFERLPARDGHRAWKEIDQRGQAVNYEAIEEIPPVRLVTRIADRNLQMDPPDCARSRRLYIDHHRGRRNLQSDLPLHGALRLWL
jgi:hypothetical protein